MRTADTAEEDSIERMLSPAALRPADLDRGDD